MIPYAGSVNPGPLMFERMGGQRFDYTNGDGPEDSTHPLREHHQVLTGDPDLTWPSSCIEMGDEFLNGSQDFSGSGLPSGGARQEMVVTQHWSFTGSVVNQAWGTCPFDKDAIQYAQVDAGAIDEVGSLSHWIDSLYMYDATGTQYGMKYALALLDPTSRDDFAFLNDNGLVPDEFADRPLDWNATGAQKIIVLMTDGNISHQYRPHDPYDVANVYQVGITTAIPGVMSQRNQRYRRRLDLNKSAGGVDFLAMCNMAKEPSRNVQIYTVAFETGTVGRDQMSRCATSPAHFFETSGTDLISVFEAIAGEVTALRVVQ